MPPRTPFVVLLLLLFEFGQWGLTPLAGKTVQELTLSQFVAGLRRAVAANDRRAVAGMVRYPIEVSAGGLQIPVPDAATFVQLYDSAFGPAVRQAVTGARVAADARAPLTLGGSLTISETAGGFRITGIKVPTGPQSKPPGEPIERHLTFRVGQPTQVSGTLEPGGTDRYVFYAVRGAYVEARLSGVPGKTVLMRVLDAKTGTPVDARADAGTRVWTGRVSADASYRIEVARQPDSGTEPLIYSMAVVVK